MELLKINNLSAGYGGKDVLHNVSFSLHKGDILSIIGQNGCGKSTLLKTISCIIKKTEGEIYFEGNDISNFESWDLVKAGVSFFTQGGLIFPSLKVKEHLELILKNKRKSEANKVIDECIETFPHLRNLLNVRGGNLSGGQKQMLSFVILYAMKTKCWLLDEPTSGLDQESVENTIQIIEMIKNKREKSIILVEHNYSVAFRLADKLAIIKDGKWVNSFERKDFQKTDFLTKHLFN